MPMESSPEQPLPLSRVTSAVRGWIDRLGAVWVEAQLIEINRRSGSRTIFLTLRDRLANVSVSVTASATTIDSAGPLSEGAAIVARLKPSYYETAGRLSYYCDAITPIGEGKLLAQLEQRKRMLQAEGLFARELKKRLPFLPRTVGLITSAGSAAEKDVIENARVRWPAVSIKTEPALVQGPQAVDQVIDALARLDADPAVEVIIIARGGGSLEDLLPFSDEAMIRAVFACRTPVVSAIGHETDNPILDLVADFRASTPTAAAKRVVPDVAEEHDRLDQARARLGQSMVGLIRRHREFLDQLRSRPVLADPTASFAVRREQLHSLSDRGHRAMVGRVRQDQSAVEHLLARVRAVSPKATLERGYSILVDGEGVAVTSVAEIDVDDDLLAYVADGQLTLAVRDIEKGGIGR
ncbi:exodeoxyribonuclease VII large subunit [Microlunatus speluncae]|uniref:exodeoxyribonuclease VII large subunit n=1 Tax=Microlunatus speluncae TaxID=2594267 RepID=UPI0012663532|nr:exodeoxyribonuclease VII large subunit [Microlunatus speluncae]